MSSFVKIEIADANGQVFTDAEQGDVLYASSTATQSLLFGAKQDVAAALAITESNIRVSTHIVPSSNLAYDLGTSNLRFRDLYLSGNTIDLGGMRISAVSSNIVMSGVNISNLQQRTQLLSPVSILTEQVVSTWTTQSTTTFNEWRAVAWSPELSMFAAVSCDSYVMTSSDGINWTVRASNTGESWAWICWSSEQSKFVAVGGVYSPSDTVLVSSDGVSWQAYSCPSNLYKHVTWSPELGMFLATAAMPQLLEQFYITSSNGINWTSRAYPTPNEWTVTCWSSQLGVFVAFPLATGYVLRSANGLTWTTHATPNASVVTCACWSPELSMFVGVCDSNVITSTNGITWVLRSGQPGYVWSSIVWASSFSIFVAVASSSMGANLMMSSYDGVTWTTRNPGDTGGLTSIAWSPELELFVTVSAYNYNPTSGLILTSFMVPPNAVVANPALVSVNNATGALSVRGDIHFKGTLNRNGVAFESGTPGLLNTPGAVYVSPGFNFGVGTSTPSTALDVNGAIATAGITRISATGALTNVSVNADMITSGVLPVAYGGTGTTSSTGTAGSSAVLSNSPTLTGTVTAQTVNASTLLFNNNAVALSNHAHDDTSVITMGVLPVARGGTGSTTSIGTGSLVLNSNATLCNVELTNTTMVSGHIVPTANVTYDLGSSAMRFRDLYLSGNTINLAGTTIGLTANSNVAIGGVNVNKISQQTQMNSVAALSNVSTWYTRPSPADFTWISVCWSPELRIYVAVADGSTANNIMTSSNGINWSLQATPVNNAWSSVCWSSEKNLFVVVSSSTSVGSNRVLTSPNGINWTSYSSTGDNLWASVCWSPELGRFVAVAYSGTNRVMYSDNGSTWTATFIPGTVNQWLSVCWSPELGIFVAVSNSVSNNLVATSTNGIAWTTYATPVSSSTWSHVCWSPELSRFVAVANTGVSLMTSTNGTTWTTVTVPTSPSLFSVCWSPELALFAAVGLSKVAISSDGTTWTTTTAVSNNWRYVCWSPELSQFCAVCRDGTGNRIMTTLPALPALMSSLIVNPSWMTLINSNGYLGLNNSNPTERLDVVGNIRNTGTIMCTGDITAFSDARVKTNLQRLTNALDKVAALNGYTFKRVNDALPDARRHVGVIAQEVQQLLPEAVQTHNDNYLSVAYGNMVALLIEAVKELDAQNQKMFADIEAVASPPA